MIKADTSLLLKEINYNESTHHYYYIAKLNPSESPKMILMWSGEKRKHNSLWGENGISAPTQSQLQKYLRNEYNLHIEILVDKIVDNVAYFKYRINYITEYVILKEETTNKTYLTYEAALEDALYEAIEMIKYDRYKI